MSPISFCIVLKMMTSEIFHEIAGNYLISSGVPMSIKWNFDVFSLALFVLCSQSLEMKTRQFN